MLPNVHRRKLFISILVTVLGLPLAAQAYTCRPPEQKKVFSPSEQYRLLVIPRAEHPKSRAQAVFSVRRKGGLYKKLSQFPLRNEVAPAQVMVSNSGRYIATFDDWHGKGYGDNVVVLYREDGSVINHLALGDFLSEGDIQQLPQMVDSIRWSGPHAFDESQGLLILRVLAVPQGTSENQYIDVPIDLKTGVPVAPPTDRFPQPRVFISTHPTPALEATDSAAIPPVCRHEGHQPLPPSEIVHLPPAEILKKVLKAPLPSYSWVARRAGIQGSALLEVIVQHTGEVSCVKVLRALPLGLTDRLQSEALGWRFSPMESEDQRRAFKGHVTVEFRWVEKDHPAY